MQLRPFETSIQMGHTRLNFAIFTYINFNVTTLNCRTQHEP